MKTSMGMSIFHNMHLICAALAVIPVGYDHIKVTNVTDEISEHDKLQNFHLNAFITSGKDE